MTCIATDGKTMAADGLEADAEILLRLDDAKIIHAKDGSVVGCAGHSYAIALVDQWFIDGCPKNRIPDLKSDKDGESPFHALILRPGGRVEQMDWNFAPIDTPPPCAIGTGGDYARAAMLLGKTPVEAVEFASQHVINVGGVVMELSPKPKTRRRRR